MTLRKHVAPIQGLPTDFSRPHTGDLVTVRKTLCRIIAVYPAGTMDVVSECGRYAWRVTGLAFR